MTGDNLPSSVRPLVAQLQRLSDRVYELERRRALDSSAAVLASLFSYPGPMQDGIESPPWHPDSAVTLTQTRVSLTAATLGDVVVEVRSNGQPLYQVTLPAGQTTVTIPSNVLLNPDDHLSVVTVQTSGGSNMSVGFVPQF